jgi:hypothetical protein
VNLNCDVNSSSSSSSSSSSICHGDELHVDPYPEVSSKVCHDSFCQFGNIVTLPWVIYYEAFYLHFYPVRKQLNEAKYEYINISKEQNYFRVQSDWLERNTRGHKDPC